MLRYCWDNAGFEMWATGSVWSSELLPAPWSQAFAIQNQVFLCTKEQIVNLGLRHMQWYWFQWLNPDGEKKKLSERPNLFQRRFPAEYPTQLKSWTAKGPFTVKSWIKARFEKKRAKMWFHGIFTINNFFLVFNRDSKIK